VIQVQKLALVTEFVCVFVREGERERRRRRRRMVRRSG
jgi:hypothetical protein